MVYAKEPQRGASTPSGRQVTNTLDTASRISTVGSVLGGVSHTYVSGVSYMPWNVPQQITLGNGVSETWTYNSRMQPLSITASTASSTLLTLNTWYCPGASPAADCATNNGNVVQGWTAPNATTTFQQTFGYDSLNRLTGVAEGTSWSQAYGYDAYGNRWATGTGLLPGSLTPASSSWYDGTTNRLTNPAVNVAYDPQGAGDLASIGSYTFTYKQNGGHCS